MRPIEWMLLVLLSVLWGATFFFVAVALPSVPPFTLVLARVGLAAVILAVVARSLGIALPADAAAWRPFIVLAILNNVIPFSLMAFGQTRIPSGLAAVLNATTPLYTLIIARLLAHEPLTPAKLAGVSLGIGGVAVLMGPDALDWNASSMLGMSCILGGALSYGLAAFWMRGLSESPPLKSTAAQLICSTVMLAPLAVIAERFWELPLPGGRALVAVLGLAVFSTALAYLVFFRISATAGPSNVMLVTLLIPVTATALGVLILGETLAPHQAAGALVIASGLVVIDGRLLRRLAGFRAP